MTTYTVNIANATNVTTPQTYVAFFGDLAGKVVSQSNETLRSVVFFQSDALGPNNRASFDFTDQILGFAGRSPSQSSGLKAGDKIRMTASEPVDVGHPMLNNGTQLLVAPTANGQSVTLTKSGGTSPGNTFTIFTDAKFTAPNFYVAGVARQIDGQTRPVAAMPVVPSQQNVITAGLTLYIGRVDSAVVSSTPGAVIDPALVTVKTQVVFASGQTEITATNVTLQNGQSAFTVA